MAYCFISDLHLQESRPDITKAFLLGTLPVLCINHSIIQMKSVSPHVWLDL